MSDKLLSEVKNELKIYIMYICDFGIDISMSGYWLKNCFEFYIT